MLLFNRETAVVLFFDLTVFSALSRLFKLKNEKKTPKLTKIALDFVKIRYNRPEL